MPIPVSPPVRVPDPGTYAVPDPQPASIQQERMRHDDALWRYGEPAVFVLMWNPGDFALGLVERCSRCWIDPDLAEAYKQPTEHKCPVCFGTTFEGGWKARVVRPSLWDDAEVQDRTSNRGFVTSNSAAVQSTSDFRLHNGDYIFRGDKARWQVRTLSGTNLSTGFGTPTDTIIGYNYGQCSLEDPSAVAYIIPPTAEELDTLLSIPAPHGPLDYTQWDDIRGPIL